MLAEIESLSERIAEYNDRIEALAQQSYPQVALLKQIKGVGTLIALTFLLTLEDPHRFGKSRDVGCYLGLQPGRRNSGQSEPQMHISKEGDPYLRTLLVAAPAETRTPNMHRAKRIAPRECGWKHGDSGYSAGREKTCRTKKQKNRLDSDRPSHGRP